MPSTTGFRVLIKMFINPFHIGTVLNEDKYSSSNPDMHALGYITTFAISILSQPNLNPWQLSPKSLQLAFLTALLTSRYDLY